ncbi:MAG TPA: hypothetical protein VH062_02960, partial [Polyangiaceae bacterium]|nr:hypothetical protein [Polyangiaceae bacterium]
GGASNGGVACIGTDGKIPQYLKLCGTAADCGTVLIGSCCSGNLIAGIARARSCTPPDLGGCSQLGCRGSTVDGAEDGKDSGQGDIQVECINMGDGGSGLCQTQVVPQTGKIPCGTTTCEVGSACVHPPTSVGGPAPRCVEALDGGTCPAGFAMVASCAGNPAGSCVETYVPPPPTCVAIPAACAAGLDCTCLSTTICGGGANLCDRATARDVYCINLAP